jgi:hypothetical protein
MPALRLEECKRIVDYQTFAAPFTRDHLLLMITLLAYPTVSDIEEYRTVVGNAYRATGLVSSEEKLELWRNGLEGCPDWRYDEGVQAWVHPWGARTSTNGERAREVQEILSLLGGA